MKGIARLAKLYVLLLIALWVIPFACFSTVGPHEIGVRQSNFSGVSEHDLEAGWALRIPGAHRIIELPKTFDYLDYTNDDVGPQQQLQIRTKDNNIVFIDVSVPYRIKEGEGWQVVTAGNHQKDANGRYRFQRLAEETTVSVLRERLAELSSSDFYSTDRRLEVAQTTLGILNEKLSDLHLEADRVLIRAIVFRPEYEQQLQQIQLNEQKKLLDEATEVVAKKEQTLDNYVQATNALAAALEQRQIETRANLERAYQVGFIDLGEETAVGKARALLEAMGEDERKALIDEAVEELGLEGGEGELDDAYLLGIRNIEAETLEYDKRTRSQADGVAARLAAEGDALVAAVRGDYESKINSLLDTPAGRAYVAWKSAENVKFDSDLVFQSRDGVPSVLRLREFTEMFMGK